MHHVRKSAAIKKFGPLFTDNGYTADQLAEAIKADPSNYTPEEVKELLEAITTPGGNKEQGDGDNTTEGDKTPAPEQVPAPTPAPAPQNNDNGAEDLNETYEQWRVEWKKGETNKCFATAVKLKKVEEQGTVRITEAEAEVMNGECNQHNAIAFFKVGK